MSDLDNFVVACEALLDEPDVAERVAEAMRPLVAASASLSAAVEEIREAPGRAAMVHRTDRLTVLGLEIAAGFVSPPHDHRLWSVVGVYEGDEDNVFYERIDTGIEKTGEGVLHEGDCLALPANAVHRIANTGASPMRALHVYGGDLIATARSQWDDVTGEELPFGAVR